MTGVNFGERGVGGIREKEANSDSPRIDASGSSRHDDGHWSAASLGWMKWLLEEDGAWIRIND